MSDLFQHGAQDGLAGFRRRVLSSPCLRWVLAANLFTAAILVTLGAGALDAWRAGAHEVFALALVALLVTAGSSRMTYLLWARQQGATASLRESEERFRLMVEGIHDFAVFMLDAEGRIATWNKGAQQLTGYLAEEIIGQPLARLYPNGRGAQDDLEKCLARARTENSSRSEGWRIRKDGTAFLANTVVTAVRDEQAALQGFTIILRDVTERRRAEQSAAKANALLLEAVESIAVGFSIYDPDDRLVTCNDAYRDLYCHSRDLIVPGVSYGELVRQEATRAQYPDAVGKIDTWVHEQVRQHRAANGTPFEQRLDDGRRLLIVEHHTPSGHIVGSRMDITELHRHRHHLEQLVEARTAEVKASSEELRASELRYRSAFEQAAVGIAHVALDGRFLRVNRKLCAIVGYTETDLLAKRSQDITYAQDLEEDQARRAQLVAGSTTSFALEKRYLRQDGTLTWVNVTVSLVRPPGRQQDYFIAVVEDIEPRKAAELALEKERASRQRILEEQVALRTAELTATNKELQGFTYAASHDMKAPLGRINSFSALLETNYRDRLEGDGLVFLNFIRTNAVRLMELVEDLLNHAQIEQKLPNIQAVDLRDMVQSVIVQRAEDIRQAGAEVTVDLPAIHVQASPQGLSQVIGNLVENALKYSAQTGTPRIDIGAEVHDGRCRLRIKDNGIGFDMVYHDKIFEIFRRLHTYEEFPGSGIGLALVKKAMERMNGRVWAESAPDAGATFYIELPT